VRLEPKRHRIAEKITWDKHVVAAGWLTWDAGSIPAASTTLNIVRFRTLRDKVSSGSRPSLKIDDSLLNMGFLKCWGFSGSLNSVIPSEATGFL
jgi:hypothetical protein